MKRVPLLMLLILVFCVFCLNVVSAETVWKDISSDGKYGKMYAPASIKKIEESNGIATLIRAQIKATYDLEAAKETIDNYEIADALPDPTLLAYSIAEVIVSPQHRTIEYVSEQFFDENDKVIWSKIYDPRTEKEINSMSFEEDYYTSIVDAVFYQGEAARCKASDRWISLWHTTNADGTSTSVLADTSTMRQRGEDSIIYWEWMEEKDVNGQVKQIKFIKKVLNLSLDSQKILKGRLWTAEKGWQEIKTASAYEKIAPDGPMAGGLQRMKAYKKGYQYWLNRYRTDKVVTLPAKK